MPGFNIRVRDRAMQTRRGFLTWTEFQIVFGRRVIARFARRSLALAYLAGLNHAS